MILPSKYLSLNSTGYPQSQVASFFAQKIMKEFDPDFLFLDCDEFLPFDTRQDLIGFLSDKADYHYLTYYWKNICPSNFDGSDISRPRDFFSVTSNRTFLRSHVTFEKLQIIRTIGSSTRDITQLVVKQRIRSITP